MISLHDALPGAIADLLKDMPLSEGKVVFAWRAAVGHSLERASRVQLTDSHVLNVEVANVNWRREIERSRKVILSRLATLLGQGTVTAISVRVRPGTSAMSSGS